MLTEWKRSDDLAYLAEVSSVPRQQGLRHVQGVFVAFWAKRARYPRVKSRNWSRQSAEYTRSAFGWRDGHLTLATMDQPLRIRWSRPLPEGAEPSTVTVSRDAAGRWFVAFSVRGDDHVAPAIGFCGGDRRWDHVPGRAVDRGEDRQPPARPSGPRPARAGERRLAGKQQGAANRAQAQITVARMQVRITDRRKGFLHTLTTRLVRQTQAVVIADRSVRNMTRTRLLAHAISDAAWGDLRSMLEYEGDWYGRDLIVIDRFSPSATTCSGCGHVAASPPLNIRQWDCQTCGTRHDRDINTARNIPAAGLAVAACEAGVRPQRQSSRTGSRL